MASGVIRVLIINRQLGFSVRIKQALEQIGGFEVAPFTSVDPALEFLQNHEIDVVLVDFTIPGESGPEIVSTVRQIRPGVALVGTPDLPDVADQMRALQLDAIVDVPCSARELKPVLERIVQRDDDSLPDTAASPIVDDSDTGIFERPGEPARPVDGVVIRTNLNKAEGEAAAIEIDGDLSEDTGTVEFVLRDQQRPPREEEAPAREVVDVFKKLAAEEPPVPGLEESGTISDLRTGVTSANLYELAESLAEEQAHLESSSSFQTAEEDRQDSSVVRAILESASQKQVAPHVRPGLDELLTNIERQFPEDVTGVRPLPSWVRDVERYVREPDFLHDVVSDEGEDAGRQAHPPAEATIPTKPLRGDRVSDAPPPGVPGRAELDDFDDSRPPEILIKPDQEESLQTPAPAARVEPEAEEPEQIDEEAFVADSDEENPHEAMSLSSLLEQEAEEMPPPGVPGFSQTEPEAEESYYEESYYEEEWPEQEDDAGFEVEQTEQTEQEEEPLTVEPLDDDVYVYDWHGEGIEVEDEDSGYSRPQAVYTPQVEEDDDAESGMAQLALDDPRFAQMALSLTQASLESTAEAILLARNNEVIAYSGDLPLEEMAKLHDAIAGDWEAKPGEARIRFATLPDSGQDYMLYSRKTEGDFTLSMVFEGTLPLRVIRQQSDKLLEALTSVPEDVEVERVEDEIAEIDELYELEESAAIAEEEAVESTQQIVTQIQPELEPEQTRQVVEEAVKSMTPLRKDQFIPYTYLWMLRDPDYTLSRNAAQALVLRMDEWLASIGWRVEILQVYQDYIYLMAHVPEGQPTHEIIEELKMFSAKIVSQFDEIGDPAELWAGSYGVLEPGRALSQDEIQEFVNFERMR